LAVVVSDSNHTAERLPRRWPPVALAAITVALLCPAVLAQPPGGVGGVLTGAIKAAATQKPLPWAGISDVTGEDELTKAAKAGGVQLKREDDRPPPSEQQVEALMQMEAEVESFARIGGAYQQTVASILRRSYLWQRRGMEQEFERQITEEERLQHEARLSAIEHFENFIEKYPDDIKYTPDAMFRLGELYYERTAIVYQNDMDRFMEERDRRAREGEPIDDLKEPRKDFSDTVELYTQLAERFPDYRRLDGVYYLIGYCLNEKGEPEKARLAWLNLLCANRYNYPEDLPPETEEEPGAREQLAEEHPALEIEEPKVEGVPYSDPFAGCEPVVADSKFYAETWLRIGEYHFDFDFTEHGLDRAVSAYSKVLLKPEDRNFNLALYKVAWTYYRASRYPEAIENFWKLVEWSEAERERTGKGSELREEAIQYLGIAFAYDDWNENQVPDTDEGQPAGIERVQNPNLMPQDKPWTPEVYQRLGYIYFDEARYPKAVDVWKLTLKRWPLMPQAPAIQNMIARAHTRNNEHELAIDARAKLSDYAEGTQWWEANKDHPMEQREAERFAKDSSINTAIVFHQQAQNVRRRCVEEQSPELCLKSQELYSLAAKGYQTYIQHYPNDPEAYELQYNLADAYYWSENYEAAAREYAGVRDSNLDDKFLSISARLVVESIKRLADKAEQEKRIKVRKDPPEPKGSPPKVKAIAIPKILLRLARAREKYEERVGEQFDKEHLLESYRYNNTLLLYQYGYWDHARSRFADIYNDRCVGPRADESGRVAWINLRNIAVSLNETDLVRQLSEDLQERKCTFAPGEAAVAAVDCSKAENKEDPRCIAGSDLTNLRYRDAVAIFEKAEKAKGSKQRKLYEQAASELVKAVNEEPGHEQAPLALEKAAIALERTSRFESAGRLYQRIIDEVGPLKAENDEKQKSLDAILSNAYFRLAYNANRFFDFDRAVESYRILADSKRFAASQDPGMKKRREDALINAAKILEYQQQYSRAADYYRRAAEMMRDQDEVMVAYYRVAEMAYKQRQWGNAIGKMREFIARYSRNRKAGELVVQAYWRIAQCRKELRQTRDWKKALGDVVVAFSQSGQKAGSMAAEYAAEAKFTLVDEGFSEFEKFSIKAGKPATLKSYVQSVTNQITAGSVEAKSRAEGYAGIPTYRRPTWTIAAFVQQGRIYEVLARAVLNTPFVVPNDLKKKMRGLPDYAKDDIKIQVEDTIRQLLDTKVRPIECLAVARYALASRAARAGNVDNQYTRQGIDRINAYGDERIAECVAEAAAKDSSFKAYKPGEFSRALRGRNLGIPVGVAPPATAGE
jgi:TolA-binding protein